MPVNKGRKMRAFREGDDDLFLGKKGVLQHKAIVKRGKKGGAIGSLDDQRKKPNFGETGPP